MSENVEAGHGDQQTFTWQSDHARSEVLIVALAESQLPELRAELIYFDVTLLDTVKGLANQWQE